MLSSLAVCLLSLAVSVSPTPPLQELKPAFFRLASWPTLQVLQADAKGRIFLLDTQTLDVYPVEPDGTLGEPERLKAGSPRGLQGKEARVLSAAMSPDGDWVIEQGFDIRLFRGGKEVPVGEAHQLEISGVGILRGQPVVVGYPISAWKTSNAGREVPAELDWIWTWDGKRWSPFASYDRGAGGHLSRLADLLEHHSAKLAGTSDGHLWVGHEYLDRIVELSPAGRELTEITIGDVEVRRLPNAQELEKAAAADARRLEKSTGFKVGMAQSTAERASLALAEGRDNRLYQLARARGDKGGGKLALHRYDPAAQSIERLFLPLSFPGFEASMAAGRDGLWLAAPRAADGVWKLTWEELEAAPWEEVEDARLQGLPLHSSREAVSSEVGTGARPAHTLALPKDDMAPSSGLEPRIF